MRAPGEILPVLARLAEVGAFAAECPLSGDSGPPDRSPARAALRARGQRRAEVRSLAKADIGWPPAADRTEAQDPERTSTHARRAAKRSRFARACAPPWLLLGGAAERAGGGPVEVD